MNTLRTDLERLTALRETLRALVIDASAVTTIAHDPNQHLDEATRHLDDAIQSLSDGIEVIERDLSEMSSDYDALRQRVDVACEERRMDRSAA